MTQILIHAPWMLPLSMCLLNVFSFLAGLMLEGRVKQGAARFMVSYATTIPSAWRGDLSPFFTVLMSAE